MAKTKIHLDIVPTAGELRAAYFRKSQIKNPEAVEKIIEVGIRLNAICPDKLKVDGKALDDFKDESVFIHQKYIQPNLQEIQFEIDNAPKITYPKQEKKSRSQDRGLSM